jgi:hypothetical protein
LFQLAWKFLDNREVHAMTKNETPYIGEIMHACLFKPFDFNKAFIVVVSGSSWNPCGHALLNTGGPNGWHFHIAEVKGRPRAMQGLAYQRYLREHKKRELRRAAISIPNPRGANDKLEELLSKPWSWFLLPNNCAAFVEDVVRAGGSDAGLYFNCPTREKFI